MTKTPTGSAVLEPRTLTDEEAATEILRRLASGQYEAEVACRADGGGDAAELALHD